MSVFKVGDRVKAVKNHDECIKIGAIYTVSNTRQEGVYLQLCSLRDPNHWCIGGYWNDDMFTLLERPMSLMPQKPLTKEELSRSVPLPSFDTLDQFLKNSKRL